MGRLVVLSENLLNTRAFTSHVLSANEQAPGHEWSRVNSGRRAKSRSYWTSITENAAAYGGAAFNRPRIFDCAFIDRDHNLGGKTVRIRATSDNWLTYSERAAVIPTVSLPYSRLSQANGVLTEEGAWGWRFDALVGTQARIYVDAMGTGMRPEIMGGWLGLSYRPAESFVKPFSHGLRELKYQVIQAPSAWAGAGEVSQRRRLVLNIRVAPEDLPSGRYHMEEHFMRARPSWIVPDDDQAERAFLSRAEPQTAGFQVENGSSYWVGHFDAPEHEPRTTA